MARKSSPPSIGDYTDLRLVLEDIKSNGITPHLSKKLYQYWYKLVKQYSACGLTEEKDKLVAISGIVDEVENLTGDRCLAGVWRRDMPRCLFWKVDWPGEYSYLREDFPEKPQPTHWRAPSWSWASLNLPVEWG